MEAGFWLTSGSKYGGDLLLYEGTQSTTLYPVVVVIVILNQS